MKIPPTILVIFGISGDLSRRYLLQAIGELATAKKLPKRFHIVGITRKKNLGLEELLEKTTNKNFIRKNTKFYTMTSENFPDYKNLKEYLKQIEKQWKTKARYLFYLSVPPEISSKIVTSLGKTKFKKHEKDIRILLEKPFGIDLKTAKQLAQKTHRYFDENQIYRIDHYLFRHIVKDMLLLRNKPAFKKIWSKESIKEIEIQASEKIGIEGRISFYKKSGVLRDMIQNHLLELLSLVLMNMPEKNSRYVPKLRQKALKKIFVILKNTKRGQYEGYHKDLENTTSTTETFVSLPLKSTDHKWNTVNLILNTGKKLNTKDTFIRLKMKNSEKEIVFRETYTKNSSAYQSVLLNAIIGDQNFFTSYAEILETWRILEPIQKQWRKNKKDLIIYKPGSTVESVISQKS